MNKELIRLKKEIIKAFRPNKEDIQAEKLQSLILEARTSKNVDINKFINDITEIFRGLKNE